jgi:hypothetical protein
VLDEARPRAMQGGNFDRAPSPTTGETAGSKHRVVIPTTRTPLDKRVSPVRRYRGSPKIAPPLVSTHLVQARGFSKAGQRAACVCSLSSAPQETHILVNSRGLGGIARVRLKQQSE